MGVRVRHQPPAPGAVPQERLERVLERALHGTVSGRAGFRVPIRQLPHHQARVPDERRRPALRPLRKVLRPFRRRDGVPREQLRGS